MSPGNDAPGGPMKRLFRQFRPAARACRRTGGDRQRRALPLFAKSQLHLWGHPGDGWRCHPDGGLKHPETTEDNAALTKILTRYIL